MLAVILAGGRGTRLGSLTGSLPKSMMPVGGKPFLWHKINNYIHRGIDRFVICAGYKSEKIEEYFKDGRGLGCRIVYSKEKKPLGTGGALKQAAGFLEDEFLLLNGDNLNFVDVKDFIHCFRDRDRVAAMAVYYNPSGDRYRSNVVYDRERRMVVDYHWSGGGDKMKFVDTGVRCFKRDIFAYFPDKEHFSIEKEIFAVLAREGEIAGYEIKKRPLDIGTPENLKSTRQVLAGERNRAHRHFTKYRVGDEGSDNAG